MNRSVAIVVSTCVLAVAIVVAVAIYTFRAPQPTPEAQSAPASNQLPAIVIERERPTVIEVPGPERKIYVPSPTPPYSVVSSGNWFIIAGSSTNRNDAVERANRLQRAGFVDASVEYSSDYPNFRPGYYIACAEKWISKSNADQVLPRVKQIVPDAYIKSAY